MSNETKSDIHSFASTDYVEQGGPFEFRDGVYVSAHWFQPFAHEAGDITAFLYRESERAPWKFWFRTRLYVSDDPLEENDRKDFYLSTFERLKTEEEARTHAREYMHTMREHFKKAGERFALRTGVREKMPVLKEVKIGSDKAEKVAEILMKLPWQHVRPTGPGGDA